MFRLGPLIILALCLGALFSVTSAGTRGWHFLPWFIVGSGFVLGVGLLINNIAERLRNRPTGTTR
jgi:hypothetical protein